MPVIVAVLIRAIIQMAVTLGLISLAEKYILPILHKAIEEVMQFFGVDEETAKDILSNEILIYAERVGIGVLALRAKLPTKIAERLGFTSKGWNKRVLTGKTAKIQSGTAGSGKIAPVNMIVPTNVEIGGIVNMAKIVLPGFLIAFNFLFKALGLTFLGFIAFNNLIDFGNWNSGAYQKTFQKIFAKVSGGLLVPDEDYRKTKTVSPDVFDKVFNAYKIEGAIGINDPYKRMSVIFTRDTLIDLLDVVGADLLRTKQTASTKDVLLASQLFIVFAESKEAPATIAAVAQATTIPQIRVFTGVLAQGTLGEMQPFVVREDDLIDSVEDLRIAAENNLSSFLIALPGKIVYEIKIVPSITTKDGFKQRGTQQRIISGYKKDGTPKYKNVVNKFAVIDIYVFTARNIRTKIQQVVLGPTDAIKFQPNINEVQKVEQAIRENIVTTDITKIKTIITPTPPVVQAFSPVALPAPQKTITPTPVMAPSVPSVTAPVPQLVTPPIVTPPPTPSVTPVITPAPDGIPWTSNNPNKCNVYTISEFFDTARVKYPLLAERAKYYEQWGLGQAAYYTGTAEQNNKFLAEVKRRSGC